MPKTTGPGEAGDGEACDCRPEDESRVDAPGVPSEASSRLFDEAFREYAAREGGALRDPRAPAGEICFGDLAFRGPSLSPDQARELYREHYWGPALCDHLPRGVALEVFDMATSSGVDAALRVLMTALRLPAGDPPRSEVILEIHQADPVRLRARFLAARLADIAGRLGGA